MKTALVTGGNRGIGLELCKQLDAHNWQVILCSRDLKKTTSISKHFSKNVNYYQLDVTDETSINKLYHALESKTNAIDVLVNNGAIGAIEHHHRIISKLKNIIKKDFKLVYPILRHLSPARSLHHAPSASDVLISDVRKVMDTNFFGVWRMIQYFIPLLKKSSNAQIINVSSGMGAQGELTGIYPAYSMSKAALNSLTIMFSRELKEQNIKVNAVCPGWVKTDMGGPDAPRTVSEGADGIKWLCMQNNLPTGKFFRDRQMIEW